MANKFVWSGATAGADDGTSWADAYLSLMRDWGAEATFTPGTDFIYVRSVHAETGTASKTITGVAASTTNIWPEVRCVVGDTTGTTPGNLATGATVTVTGATSDIVIAESIYIYGVEFFAGDDILVCTATDGNVLLERCRLELTGTNTGDAIIVGPGAFDTAHVRLSDTNIDFGHKDQGITVSCLLEIEGGTLGFDVDSLFEIFSLGVRVFVRSFDLSVMATAGDRLVADSLALGGDFHFSRCLLHANTGFTDTLEYPGLVVSAFHCQAGTDSDPAYQMEVHTKYGVVKTATASYRTGGASDGERTNPISWDLDTTLGHMRAYPAPALRSIPIVGWTDGDGSTAHTYRIYFASGGTQQDDDIWFDLIGPNDAATNSLGVRNTTRVAPEGTPANYTTDGSSTWTGADVGTKQYMEITYTPDKPGPIHAIVHMVTDAGSTGHIFVDPIIVVDP